MPPLTDEAAPNRPLKTGDALSVCELRDGVAFVYQDEKRTRARIRSGTMLLFDHPPCYRSRGGIRTLKVSRAMFIERQADGKPFDTLRFAPDFEIRVSDLCPRQDAAVEAVPCLGRACITEFSIQDQMKVHGVFD